MNCQEFQSFVDDVCQPTLDASVRRDGLEHAAACAKHAKNKMRNPIIDVSSFLRSILLHSLVSCNIQFLTPPHPQPLSLKGERGEGVSRIKCYSTLALLIFMYGGKAARAQQPPASGAQPASSSGSSPVDSTQPKNDRVLGVIPNYRTVEYPQFNIQPLTVRGKFKLAVEDSFDPYAYPVALIFAGLAQRQNDPKTWGRESWGPFTKRFAASFADQTDENLMTEAVVPALLKQDPRYFRLGSGSFFKRSSYAVSRTWVTRTDAGGTTFNFSEIAGAGISSAISNLYYPPEDRTLSKNLSQWGIMVGEDAFFNMLKEYWPDIKRKVLKR